MAARASARAHIAAVTSELAGLTAAAAGSNVDDEHDPEGSTLAFERAQLTAVLAQAQGHLREIEAALHRLDAGRYGWCEGCGAAISPERLAARPDARRCVACASRPR